MSFFGSFIPLEYFMYGAIGFFAAWLMAFMCFPAVHNRAQRLLRKQYEQTPISVKEMQAEKDQIRAGFAAATRGLEISLDKLKEKTAAHATELARKVQVIERLKKEIDALDAALVQSTEREREARGQLLEAREEFEDVNASLASLAERERGLRAELRETRRELALKDSALDAAEQEVAAIKTEIARLAPRLQMPARPTEMVPLAPVAVPPQPALPLSHDDGVMRAWTEIDAAARRIDQRYDGTPLKKPLSNQALRAAYAPAMKPTS